MALKLHVADQAWGGTELVRSDPQVEEHRDIYALPYERDGRWGLFDAQDQVIETAVDRGWPDARPQACVPESPTTLSALSHALPDDVEYIYGGVYQPHFGHYLLESLSRLWPLVDGLKPNQRLLMHGPGHPENWWTNGYVRDTLGALDITVANIVHLSAPVRISRVLVPMQSLRVNAFVYPAYGQLCRRIGERLTGGGLGPPNVRPVFLSKARLSAGVTGICNEQILIEELERCGVEIIFPEQLDFAKKIGIFSSRKVVSGWATSAQHVSAFSSPAHRIEMLTGGLALNSNCVLIDKVNGNTSRYWDAEMEEVKDGATGFLTKWSLVDPIATAHKLLERL